MVNDSTHHPRPSPPQSNSIPPSVTAIVHLPNQVTTPLLAGDATAPLAFARTGISTLSSLEALLRGLPVPINANWECEVCARSMRGSSKDNHLGGKPHAKNKLKWEAERQKEKKREADKELRRTEQVRVEEQTRMDREQKERQELRRTEQIRIEEQEQWEREEKALYELRRAEQIQFEEETRKNQEKERAELRRTEQIRIEEEQLRIAEEKREMELVRKEKRDRENAAAALWIHEQRIKQDNQRKEWMRKQEEAAETARRMEELLRNEQENRRKEWMRQREEQVAVAWQMEEQLRIEEETRRKEWMRKQEDEAALAWRMEEQLRVEDDKQRMELVGQQEAAAAAEWQVGKSLRLEQENCRKEWRREKEEAAAAEHTRMQQLRNHEEEALQKQELHRAKQREYVHRIAEQAELRAESRREELYQHQTDDGLTHERVELIDNVGGQRGVKPNLSAPGGSLFPIGSFQQSSPTIQNSGENTSIERLRYQAVLSEFLQWQVIIQQFHRQRVQPVPETLPIPVTSVTDLPPVLYRVYDDTSVSKYSWEGFSAAAGCMPRDAMNFKNMVHLHGNWSSREGTPFISVTSSPDIAAMHVRTRQATRNQSNIMVALIDTATLLGQCQTRVWKMHDARDHFALQPWKCLRRAYDHEYICALRIPARAIFACCHPDYFKQNALMFLESLERRN